MHQTEVLDVDSLLHPISPERPGGEDVTFDPVYDEIRDARTQDDPRLAAGAWSRELKVADWPRVVELSTATLRERSKNLQIACWLTEALAERDGFAGVAAGLRVLAGLLREHWDSLHPLADDGDLEPRANCLSWLNTNIAREVRAQPLTTEGHGWFDWKTSLDVDNAGLRDKNAKAALMAEGKIDGEIWRKQVAATPSETYAQAHAELLECRRAFDELKALIDQCFGADAPGLGELKQAIDEVSKLVAEIATQRGVAKAPEPEAEPEAPAAAEDAAATEAVAATAAEPAAAPAATTTAGPVQTRQEALKRLREISDFFRRTEPHSPVAYMLDRAVRWANMPLDLWLQEVVKDPHVLSILNETLGVDRNAAGGAEGGAEEEA